jgi:hypothetical protein
MRRENTDDVGLPAVKKQRAPYHMLIAMELTLPKRIAQDYTVSAR